MPFYKFLLKTGHVGSASYQEMPLVLYAKTYTQAIKMAKSFPAVKRRDVSAIISSTIIEESEYIKGIVQNSYIKTYDNEDEINKLSNCVRILSYIKDYQFITEEGKKLKSFCDTYINAKNNVKPLIEREYEDWARSIIFEQNNEIRF